jgi:hypothetical protein
MMRSFIAIAVFLLVLVLGTLTLAGAQTDTLGTLDATIKMYKNQVDSLQALPQMPAKQFYVAVRNLSTARSTRMLYIARTNPERAELATKTAVLLQKRAVAFNDKAEAQ